MLSLQDIAALKSATVICNDPELKRKILYPFDGVTISGNEYDIKQKWGEIVEKQAIVTLTSQGLSKILQEKVMGIVPAIAMRILTWALYHEKILKFSRQYSVDFLKISLFTQQGIIDNKIAAGEIMKDENLSVEQRYIIACLYCLTDHIPALFRQLAKEDRIKFCSIGSQSCSQSELVRFWSNYQMDVVDKVKGGKTLDQYILKKAIESGNKAAVEYYFEKINLRMTNNAIVDAAVKAVSNRIRAWYDEVVFRTWMIDDNYCNTVNWVPSAYYIDIVCFLLSKMTVDQQIEFLKKDIEGAQYPMCSCLEHNRSRVLEYFLNWPYQGYFLKMARLMWEFLPEGNYAVLLLKICYKIEPGKENNLKYFEEKSYDYRGLLKEFWYKSPDRYKRYVLSNQTTRISSTYNPGVSLLIKLLLLNQFTFEDGQIIEIILASAEDNEKENIMSSKQWRRVFIQLVEEGKLKILDLFVLSHFSSMQVHVFKRAFVLSRDFYDVVFQFAENNRWDAADSAVKWSSVSEEEVNTLKNCLIKSKDAERTCLKFTVCKGDVEVTNTFIKWCIVSDEEIREYKEKLISSMIGKVCCKSLVQQDKVELVDKITNCWLFSREKIKQFKDEFQCLMGYNICESLISAYFEGSGSNTVEIIFQGGKWEEVEKFLTWCFSSEEEIVDFKKRLLKNSGKKILLNLISSSQWAEAETFFAWLGLSIDEIKKLKKDTVLDCNFIVFFYKLLSMKDRSSIFVYYGSKKEAIELILRWCLTDKETVLEFKDKFKNSRKYLFYYGRGYLQEVSRNFDFIIEQRLKDIHEEEKGVKRKSETVFSPNKKLCNFQLVNVD